MSFDPARDMAHVRCQEHAKRISSGSPVTTSRVQPGSSVNISPAAPSGHLWLTRIPSHSQFVPSIVTYSSGTQPT